MIDERTSSPLVRRWRPERCMRCRGWILPLEPHRTARLGSGARRGIHKDGYCKWPRASLSQWDEECRRQDRRLRREAGFAAAAIIASWAVLAWMLLGFMGAK